MLLNVPQMGKSLSLLALLIFGIGKCGNVYLFTNYALYFNLMQNVMKAFYYSFISTDDESRVSSIHLMYILNYYIATYFHWFYRECRNTFYFL